MSSVQIGLLMLFTISAFGFITLSVDVLRARRLNKGKKPEAQSIALRK
ncbi:hypothetical protein [Pseudomonas purpurea]